MAEKNQNSTSQTRAAARLSRSANACQRCRRRKQKCDLKYPKCTNCDDAQTPCLSYHPGKGAEIPRNYISSLEAQVEKLTKELEELRIRTSTSPNDEDGAPLSAPDVEQRRLSSPGGKSSATEGSGTDPEDLIRSMGLVVVEPSNQPRFFGTSSGISLARLVMAAIRVDIVPSPTFMEQEQAPPSYTPVCQASLPPRHAADHLVEVYFQYRTHHLHILERSQVEEAIESAYLAVGGNDPGNRVLEKDIFTAYMVFAIALCDVHNPSGGRPSQSEGCFHSAVRYMDKVFVYAKSDLDTLSAILLLAQYVALCPSKGSLWQLTGTALRLCIDMGLHWETESVLDIDPDVLNERRRLFWSTYLFDRLLCITLGRPFGIVDQSISVEYPNPYSGPLHPLDCSGLPSEDFVVHSRRAANHLITMSRLESEIKHVLYHQLRGAKLAYPRANYSVWIRDIQPRLQEWHSSVPQPSKANPASIFACQSFWDAIYNNALLLLHRPNPNALQPSLESLRICYDAACRSIASIKVLHREQKIDILWIWVHHLFMAGLTVMYCLWHSKEVREQASVKDSISTLQSCASTLSALSERFAGASGCRDAFETLSSATINWLIANDSEAMQENQLLLGKQLQNFQQQWPGKTGAPTTVVAESAADDVLALLSNDSFGFGETLSEAAQWPAFGGLEFNMDFEPVGERLEQPSYALFPD